SLEQTVSNVIAAIDASGERVTGRPQIYALLSLLPIIKEPLLTESSKLMFLIGKKFAEDPRSRDTEKSLERLANFLDIQDVSVKREKKQTSVTLRYGSHNSMEGFMELSIKAFIGFLSKRFNSIVKVRESRFRRNYAVTLSITEGA
ncbi:MAG TPA: hypothetical protein VL945_00400, partial [Candidatus Saccharimonadales bacterium]|nr:hypothetical protein [Candidatus Saccharimonadales bacterium]